MKWGILLFAAGVANSTAAMADPICADRPGKAEALRRAQRDVRAVPRFRAPRFWAAFQLVGAS